MSSATQQVRLPEVGAGAARGHKVTLANKQTIGEGRRTGKTLHQFDVHLDGALVGQVRAVERTENIKAAGARYVTRTKHSLGWHHVHAGSTGRMHIEKNRLAAILDLVNTALADRT
ncbi:hypothetical protein ACWGJ9_11460 [Curtobacterium citreum]